MKNAASPQGWRRFSVNWQSQTSIIEREHQNIKLRDRTHHGKSKVGVKPAPRHAELAVNLAGALAVYLLATWEARSETTTS